MIVTLCTVTAAVLASGGPLPQPQPSGDAGYPRHVESSSRADVAAFNNDLHRFFSNTTTAPASIEPNLCETYGALSDQRSSFQEDSLVVKDVPDAFEDVISGRADRLRHALSDADTSSLRVDADVPLPWNDDDKIDPAARTQGAALHTPGPVRRLLNALTPTWLTPSTPAPITVGRTVYPMRTYFCDQTGVIESRVVDYVSPYDRTPKP